MIHSYKEQHITALTPDAIESKADEMKKAGYRIEQICARSKDGVTTLLYSFDKDFDLQNFRVTVPQNMTVPSISKYYWAAFIYENEVHDLFGVTFTGLVLDYKGNFFKLEKLTPWKTEPKTSEGGE
ncbi:MAG: NADH-quinone oxidoreductase subunit C [Candidatus Methanomethylophilus sp.]|nr:NADH-quinone oxidoreductase subunit C [Methanomethylophilus sp.]MDD3233403.1 NADH-quinone oxidoreductase subunit C [Methanomethylophilus sp.]MDD4221971.1 NADH-quinone oxidoreductase subunit C [Methanomethylophilus sp.]MDD4668316.1 NADH-quinone oxidoreductase subunit C [Methanomethylophilus sp.]